MCGPGENCGQHGCCLPVTATSGDVTSLGEGVYTLTTQGPSGSGALRIDVAAGTTFGDLVRLASTHQFAAGTCTEGMPRFVVFLTDGRCPYAAFPPDGDCDTEEGHTANLIGNETPAIWNDNLCGGDADNDTYAEVNAAYADVTIDHVALVVDTIGSEIEVTVRPCVSTVGEPILS